MWAAAQFALSGLLGPSWLAKLVGIAAAVLAISSAYLVWQHKVYMRGWNDHVTAIALENKAAIEESRRVLSTVRGCRDRGLRYDQTTGNCVGR